MIYILKNIMEQTIKHRGQLCVGDVVLLSNQNFPCDVLKVNTKKGTAIIKFVDMPFNNLNATFVEGKGWYPGPNGNPRSR